MAVNMPPIRRTMKNVMHNYTDAQVKVREATSNDPWGPSSTLMSEVADLTYNVVAYSEIMQMIWKRLNDHGKNWRHVYKALVLLDYLIKTGSEKVAQQCKENIFAIQTLKDFQYTENNKDQGVNVREKAKQLVSLLKDDERLKNERARALKAKERFAQNTSGIGSDSTHGRSEERKTAGSFDENHSSTSPPAVDIEAARPSTAGEEELQLQLALAMSKEEAEQQERLQRGDDLRLKMALTQSEEESKTTPPKTAVQNPPQATQQPSLLDLDLSLSAPASDPWAPHQATAIAPPQAAAATDPWSSPILPPAGGPSPVNDPWLQKAAPPAPRAARGNPWSNAPSAHHSRASTNAQYVPAQNDPWSPVPETKVDPWGTPMPAPPVAQVSPPPPTVQDPFAPAPTVNGDNDFDMISQRPNTVPAPHMPNSSSGLGSMESMMKSLPTYNQISATDGSTRTRTPEHFLGEHTSLVNLDALITKSESSASTNPFAASVSQPQSNPFHAQQQPKVPMNQMVRDPLAQSFTPAAAGSTLPEPLLPVGSSGGNQQQQKSATTNPFL